MRSHSQHKMSGLDLTKTMKNYNIHTSDNGRAADKFEPVSNKREIFTFSAFVPVPNSESAISLLPSANTILFASDAVR